MKKKKKKKLFYELYLDTSASKKAKNVILIFCKNNLLIFCLFLVYAHVHTLYCVLLKIYSVGQTFTS